MTAFRTKFTLLSSLLLLIVGCATSTPYAPASERAVYGYSSTQIESNRWTVRFEGNSLTELETVENYLLYRAAELTLEQGYDYFITVDRKTDEEIRLRSTGQDHLSPFHASMRFGFYHPAYGWGYRRDPFLNDFELREISKYSASAEIILRKGQKPEENVNAYNASEIVSNLADTIILPPAA